MRFVRSLTVSRSEILEFLRLWELSGDPRSPFEDLILTPLPGLTDPSRVSIVRERLAGHSNVTFDSGGYAVQQGLISYEDLYQRLLSYYRANDWADAYVLPDFVPTSDLDDNEVEARVQATIAVAKLFYAELPPALREHALPVVQGRTRRHMRTCTEAYVELGCRVIGFGSFGTTGASNDINIMTAQSIDLLGFLSEVATQYDLRIHAFGIGSPALLPVLYEMGIYSFDSSCWLRTAGFGNVFLPFVKRRSISGGRLREKAGHRPLTRSEFEGLKQETDHACFFCASFDALKMSRFYQILHNLTVIMDTVESLNQGKYLDNPWLIQQIEASAHIRNIRQSRGQVS